MKTKKKRKLRTKWPYNSGIREPDRLLYPNITAGEKVISAQKSEYPFIVAWQLDNDV